MFLLLLLFEAFEASEVKIYFRGKTLEREKKVCDILISLQEKFV